MQSFVGAVLIMWGTRQVGVPETPFQEWLHDSIQYANWKLAKETAKCPYAMMVGGMRVKGGTYLLRDTERSVMRSGRSKDLRRREGDHARDPVLKDYEFEPVHRTDVYKEQRGLEQVLHDTFQPPLNKVRPISPQNPNLQEYLDAAKKYLGGL
ncbi:MAG: hypothetical protein C0404_07680 [Verrucomicrobia bacterium]|nr:hypothetical protein [Verrucomicrobiota bacterium]